MVDEVLVSGASGLIGRALAGRRAIVPLPRRAPADGGPWWDPRAGVVHDDGRPLHAVVHLAGEDVAGGRWTAKRMAEIERSRIEGTRTLVDWLAARAAKPRVLVAASAIGFYGDRGDEPLSEDAGAGEGFLADLCRRWEQEALRAEQAGIRVVCLRIGLVLARGDGLLGRLEGIFRLGAGGPLASGRQWFPWVHCDDVVGAIEWAIEREQSRGAYNLAAPGVVRQGDFARARPRAAPAGPAAHAGLRAAPGVRPPRRRVARVAARAPGAPFGRGLQLPLSGSRARAGRPVRRGVAWRVTGESP